ncbi:MAG: YbhB/YbcL family Raf kinase inhibitor-like protein [Acidimicrobiia bacterium]
MARFLGGVAVVVVVVVVTLLVATAGPASARRDRFEVTSPAFSEGGTIPDGFTCTGAGASPPFVWRGVPKGTEELALVMEDLDGPGGRFVHWVAWGIDPAARRLPEEVLPAGVDEGSPHYFPPCPPPGDDAHRYRITMYALDAPAAAGVNLATAADLRAAIKGHVLAKDRTTGTYAR